MRDTANRTGRILLFLYFEVKSTNFKRPSTGRQEQRLVVDSTEGLLDDPTSNTVISFERQVAGGEFSSALKWFALLLDNYNKSLPKDVRREKLSVLVDE